MNSNVNSSKIRLGPPSWSRNNVVNNQSGMMSLGCRISTVPSPHALTRPEVTVFPLAVSWNAMVGLDRRWQISTWSWKRSNCTESAFTEMVWPASRVACAVPQAVLWLLTGGGVEGECHLGGPSEGCRRPAATHFAYTRIVVFQHAHPATFTLSPSCCFL